MAAINAIAREQLLTAASRPWDVLVVGAGPAGAVAARQIAKHGVRVLLFDRAVFPRPKVCGCCLSARGVRALEQIGLAEFLPQLDGVPLRRALLATGGKMATIALPPGGIVVSREIFDTALVREAIAAGAELLEGVTAKLADRLAGKPQVHLSMPDDSVSISPSIVVVADGLHGGFLEGIATFSSIVARKSRIGVGALLDSDCEACEPGVIYMAVGGGGYVGSVRLNDGTVDVAAAMDRRLLGQYGAGESIRQVVSPANLPWSGEFSALRWHGTPPLTRRLASVAADRVFVIGDAAGYVEPFTGEGMTWAILSAVAVAPIVAKAVQHYTPASATQWRLARRQLLGSRMLVCQTMCSALRSAPLRRIAVATVSAAPGLGTTVMRYVSGHRDGVIA
jgi:flavin-dependent dehydrogenase